MIRKNSLLSICLVLFGCTITGTLSELTPLLGQDQIVNQQPPKTIDIVAVVNGKKLTRQQLAQEALLRFGEPVLENLVYKQLILLACQEQGVKITRQDIESEVDRLARKLRITKEQYLQTMTQRLNTDVNKYYRDLVWPSLALRMLAEPHTNVTDVDVKKRMDAKFGPRVQCRMIVLKDPKKANEILQQVKQNPNEFGRLAKNHSEDPATASLRGMMRPIALNLFEPEVEKAVFKLQPGEISDVVQLQNQYLIFKCERHFQAPELTEQQLKFYEQQTMNELKEEKLTEVAGKVMADLQKRYKVVNVYNNPQLREQMPGVAATIGNHQIQVRHLSEECIARHGAQVLEGEINRELLKSTLERSQLEVTQVDIDTEVDRAADAYGFFKPDGVTVDREKWLDFVTKEDGVTVELYVRDAVWPTAALKKLVEGTVSVTTEDLQKSYEANFGETVEALAIVCDTDRQAQRVWKLAKQNPSKEYFGELASKHSTEPSSRENFGQIPPIAKNSGRPQLEQQAFELQPGEMSGLINVGQKWIILKCVGRREGSKVDINVVKEDLAKDILEKKTRIAMNKRFDQIRSSSQIDNFITGTSQSGAKRIATNTGVERNRLPFQARKP